MLEDRKESKERETKERKDARSRRGSTGTTHKRETIKKEKGVSHGKRRKIIRWVGCERKSKRKETKEQKKTANE